MSKDNKDTEQTNEAFLNRRRHRWWDVRANFLTGIVVAAPIVLTGYLAITLVNFADRVVQPLFAPLLPEQFMAEYSIPGLGLIVFFVGITLLGALTANFFGHALVRFVGGIIDRVPVVRTIYGGIQQIFETVVSQSERSFQEVGLIEYPRAGLWAICFVAADTKGEIIHHTKEEMMSVFLPTTPNPTSGFLLFVPRKDITLLDMSVEEGAKLVVSGGLIVPDFDPNNIGLKKVTTAEKKAAAKAQKAISKRARHAKQDDAA